MFAKDITCNDCPTVKINTSVDTISKVFSSRNINQLPVVDEYGGYVGLVAKSDIDAVKSKQISLEASLIPLTHFRISPVQHVYEAFEIMTANDLKLLPVVDIKNLYVGSIDEKDLIKHLTSITGILHKGAVITVKTNDKEVLLSKICNIIESNGAQVLSIYTTFNKENTIELVIKLNVYDISSIVQSFSRLSYVVETYNGQTDVLNTLIKQRIDNLLNFINM